MTDEPLPVLEYAQTPRQRRWRLRQFVLIWGAALLLIIACATIGFFLQTPTYRVTGFLMQMSIQTNLTPAAANTESQRMATYLQSPAVQQHLLQHAGQPVTPQAMANLARALKIIPVQNSKLILVSYEDPSGTAAATTVNAVMSQALLASPMTCGVGQQGYATSTPERDWAGAWFGALAGVMLVLAYRIILTVRHRRRTVEK